MIKKIFKILAVLSLILAVVIPFFIKPLVLSFTEIYLKKIFKGAMVSIAGCRIKPLAAIEFIDIDIQKAPYYSLKVREARISYTVKSLFRKSIKGVLLKDSYVYLDMSEERGFLGFDFTDLSASRPRDQEKSADSSHDKQIFLDYIELSNAAISLVKDTLTARINVSCGYEPRLKQLDFAEVSVPFFKQNDFNLENAFLKIGEDHKGEFVLERVKYNKIVLADIKSTVILDGSRIIFDSIGFNFCGGRMESTLDVKLDKDFQYNFRLKAFDLDLSRLNKDLELTEKFEMTGSVKGALNLRGGLLNIGYLDGNFFTSEHGGILVIKDTGFLENISKRTKQPLHLLVESFENYKYNIGLINIGKANSNIVLDVKLNGNAGKRELTIVLHDD